MALDGFSYMAILQLKVSLSLIANTCCTSNCLDRSTYGEYHTREPSEAQGFLVLTLAYSSSFSSIGFVLGCVRNTAGLYATASLSSGTPHKHIQDLKNWERFRATLKPGLGMAGHAVTTHGNDSFVAQFQIGVRRKGSARDMDPEMRNNCIRILPSLWRPPMMVCRLVHYHARKRRIDMSWLLLF